MKQLRQFLGLTSHYCHFIMGYAKVAHPLYLLTKTGAVFQWIADCEAAFENLRSKLLTATVLAYPDFDRDFMLETNVSKQGLEAILSQYQESTKLHTVVIPFPNLSPTMPSLT